VLTPRSGGLRGDGIEVSRTQDVSGIILTNGTRLESEELQESANGAADEAARLSGSPDPIEIAMEDPNLSDGARAHLEAWRARDRERSEQAIRKYEAAAEFWREEELR
jgi:hypothetical protein